MKRILAAFALVAYAFASPVSLAQSVELLDGPYACVYKRKPMKVPAAQYALNVLNPKDGKMACIAATECNWNTSPPFSPHGWIQKYSSWVACLPSRDGKCSQSYKDCAQDERIDYLDEVIADRKIRQALKLPLNDENNTQTKGPLPEEITGGAGESQNTF